jgi:hypothetical protein
MCVCEYVGVHDVYVPVLTLNSILMISTTSEIICASVSMCTCMMCACRYSHSIRS